MSTKLTRQVSRQTLGLTATKKARICERTDVGARPVIVELLPGDSLAFRIKGTRIRYELPLVVAFQVSQVKAIQEEYKKKLARYKELKADGKRATKPKKPYYPYRLNY